MAANIDPIYTLVPNVGTTRITAQQATSGRSDGGGTIATDIFLAFTAGSNGSFVRDIKIKPAATAAATATTATAIRVYISTQGSGATTSANTKLVDEVAVPSVTAASTTTPVPTFSVPLNFAIPSGTFILVGSGAAIAANTEFHVEVIGGDY